MALTVLMVALVQTSDEDDDISLLSLCHSLSGKFFLRTGLIERTAYCHAIVTLYGVSHITTDVVKGWALSIEV